MKKQKITIIPIDISTIKKIHIETIKSVDVASPVSLDRAAEFKLYNYSAIIDDTGKEYRYTGNFKELPAGLLAYFNEMKCEHQQFNYTIKENFPRGEYPKYKYDWHDIKVKCRWCKKKSKLSKLEEYESDDYYKTIIICPKCKVSNCIKGRLRHESKTDEELEFLRTKICY